MEPTVVPTLTVLLPVYNGEKYVAETIESVLSQSFSDFELLLLDDGSTDGTSQILERFAKIDPRVRVLRHDNQGVALTLDRGLKEARGVYVAEIGADDVALAGRFAKQIDFFRSNVGYVLLGSALRVIDEDGLTIGIRKYPTTNRALRAAMLLYNPFGAPSVMFRRGLAIDCGGFTTRFRGCEDYDFILRLAKHGGVANLPEPLVAYRMHPATSKAANTLQQLRDTIAVKRAATKEYGYHLSVTARLVNAVQSSILLLPPRVTYWLFQKVVVRQES